MHQELHNVIMLFAKDDFSSLIIIQIFKISNQENKIKQLFLNFIHYYLKINRLN